jgi:hypothetical protein
MYHEMEEVGYAQKKPGMLYNNNSEAALTKNTKHNPQVKHIDIRHHFMPRKGIFWYSMSLLLPTSQTCLPKLLNMSIINMHVFYYIYVRIPHISSKGECCDKCS